MHLIYATYQYFPDSRTNTFQTMSTIKEFIKIGYKVDLIFPDRKKIELSKNIHEFYDLSDDLNITKVKHKSKNQLLNNNLYIKVKYLFNHFVFSFKIRKIVKQQLQNQSIIFTRSPFITFTLKKFKVPIVFEVHQFTKISRLLIKLSLNKSKQILFVAVSPGIEDILVSLNVSKSNIEYLETGYNEELFTENEIKKIDYKDDVIQIIFGGSLTIQGVDKGVSDLIEVFDEISKENISKTLKLKIYCSNEIEKELITDYIFENRIISNIEVNNRIPSLEFARELLISDIGLIPLPNTNHVNLFSSSMKFFEYIRANLFIIGSNVEANKRYEYSRISLYENSKSSIKNCFLYALENYKNFTPLSPEKIKEYSFSNRVNKIINKINQF